MPFTQAQVNQMLTNPPSGDINNLNPGSGEASNDGQLQRAWEFWNLALTATPALSADQLVIVNAKIAALAYTLTDKGDVV